MTSEQLRKATEAYVWVWLPGATDPVVAARLNLVGDIVNFNYGQSYLALPDAIPLYLPELPLESGEIGPPPRLTVAGCIADAAPDAWGQRVIMNRMLGDVAATVDPAALGLLTYLLESGSDRIGALDFQRSPSEYVARDPRGASLEELLEAAELVDNGLPLPPALSQALVHGSSIGGARPKALVADGDRRLIAKFSSRTDPYSVVKGEYVAMELARRVGLEVAPVELAQVLGKDVLLVERFDRQLDGGRRAIVSALTILGLSEHEPQYASYAELAQTVRRRFTDARASLHELFARIVFNVLVGNTDDHARNHAAFWDGEWLTLTPAYDICPQPRGGGEATQAMAIGPDGARWSRVVDCVAAAPAYQLSEAAAREIVDRQIGVIEAEWPDVCDRGRLTAVERRYFWHRQFLNPYALEGYRRSA
jgi:serine/threonine-protein kinase HipA